MKNIFRFLIVIGVIFISCGKVEEPEPVNTKEISNEIDMKGIYNKDGVLKYKGDDFYGIGVNYYNLFQRVFDNPDDRSFIDGLERLSEVNIPFVRFRAGGFMDTDWEVYELNKEQHYKALDKIVDEAERLNIGLIPTFFWSLPSVSVYKNELLDEFGNDESKTITFIKNYTREVVERYKDSPAIWAWEFGNENNYWADMPVEVFGVESGEFTEGNMFHGEDMVNAYREFAQTIRELDSTRIIMTGNAEPRRYIWNNIHGNIWKTDSEEQHREILLRDNPNMINTITIRGYYNFGDQDMPMGILYFDDYLAKIKPWSEAVGKPICIGEFGAKEDYTFMDNGIEITITKDKLFQDRINSIVKHKIQLSALWVYDFDGQDEASGNFWNCTFTNSRSYMLDAIIKANKELLSAGR